jgi:hypothetical protein
MGANAPFWCQGSGAGGGQNIGEHPCKNSNSLLGGYADCPETRPAVPRQSNVPNGRRGPVDAQQTFFNRGNFTMGQVMAHT